MISKLKPLEVDPLTRLFNVATDQEMSDISHYESWIRQTGLDPNAFVSNALIIATYLVVIETFTRFQGILRIAPLMYLKYLVEKSTQVEGFRGVKDISLLPGYTKALNLIHSRLRMEESLRDLFKDDEVGTEYYQDELPSNLLNLRLKKLTEFES